MRALQAGREAGLALTANSQINKLNMDRLPEMKATLAEAGVEAWQVQLTGPLGRAADHPEWIVDPWDIVPIIDTLARIQLDAMTLWEQGGRIGRPFTIAPSNNIGYFGPHEQVLRSYPFGDDVHYGGCTAGKHLLGIESDGTLKGCPTLPTQPYGTGHARDLESRWATDERLGFSRHRTVDELWGFCSECYYRETCKGGCTWLAHTTLGRRGNNPFCYHRVIELQKRGVRERLVRVERAPGLPFDHGRFEIALEPWPTDP
jgi:radical SAM protein with 4Fe4S-binding SPASM domain